MAITIAGFDSSCGAGTQADCRTFERLGVYGVAAATAIVAQSPGSVSAISEVPLDTFRAQLREASEAYPLAAAKTGMLANLEIIAAVAEFFASKRGLPLVIDPVLKATAGSSLLSCEKAKHALVRQLFPVATLITPNIPEAETLLGIKITNLNELEKAAQQFCSMSATSVLLKGGHLEHSAAEVCDVLCMGGECLRMTSERLAVPDLHGTGCTLSAAISAHLAHGVTLEGAVRSARENLHQWMVEYHSWKGSRPVETHALNAIRPSRQRQC